jgi:hypothetical protein
MHNVCKNTSFARRASKGYREGDMKLATRRILFVFFLLVFVVAAPMIVLYTAGYRFHFRSWQIVQTGVLSLTSFPRGSTVVIDDIPQSPRTPTVFKNLIPGSHTIRVEHTGYTSWEKTLEIKSRATTFADDITLFSLSLPNRFLALTKDSAVTVHRESGSIAHLKRDEEWTEVWVEQADGERLVSRLPLAPGMPVTMEWSADGGALALRSEHNNRTEILLVSLIDGASLPVTELYPGMITGWWDPRVEGRYFVQDELGVWDVSFPDGKSPILHEDAQRLTLDNGEYVTLQSVADRTAVSVQQATSIGSLLTYLPRGNYAFADAPRWLSLLVEPTRQEIIIIDRGQSEPIRLTAQAIAWRWDKSKDRLLYTDGYELHLYDRRTRTDETLTRVSDPIIDVAWDIHGNAVFYAQQTTVSSVELDRRDQRNTAVLVHADTIKHLWTSPEGTTLFVEGTINGSYGIWNKELE